MILLFLDTADTTQWQTWLPTGLFYGVTTNPLLLKRANLACRVESLQDLAQQAFQLGAKEVHLQTWGTAVHELVKTGQRLATIDERIVVKVPITQVGTEAATQLIQGGIRLTLTGVYAVHQVLIAAALGADYVAPYLGRINDLGRQGRAELIQMQQAIRGVNSNTRILAASLRCVEDITVLATHGLDTFTVSDRIAEAFFDVAETQQAAIDFEAAARQTLK